MSTSFEPGEPAPEGSIPLCVPEIRGHEWEYIKQCLDTNFVSSVGPFVDHFERELAAYLDMPYAIATVNGTAALHIALLVAGVRADDEVLVSALTFIAPANAIRYVGAYPVFIDAEPVYWQMDPQHVADYLNNNCVWQDGELRNRHTGRRISAILPVHILGHPCDMDPLLELARRYQLVVIEDATESLGASYKGQRVGGLGDIACFSFNGNKVITTGGGGMIVTTNKAWARRARYLITQAKDDTVEFIHGEIGFNYRLTNLQAAMGCAQLELLDEYIVAKRMIASKYNVAFSQTPGLQPMKEAPWAKSIFWMYTVLIDPIEYGLQSRELLLLLEESGIQSRPLWQPMHKSPVFAKMSSLPCPVAEHLNERGLSLPCSVGLDESEQEKVTRILKSLSQ